jgi:Domain of unknown function (DUF397)
MDTMTDPVITAPWRMSSHTNPDGDCVEVAGTETGRLVRDSKNRGGPTLAVGIPQWAAFITGVLAESLR